MRERITALYERLSHDDDDFTPFRNIMNEWYARDTSKKIKSTFKVKGNSGKHVAGSCPYGYLKDEHDGDHWIVGPEAAALCGPRQGKSF